MTAVAVCLKLMYPQFERGRIAYLLTATLTRPNTLSPTLTNEQPVKYKDNVDVAALALPQIQRALLSPVERTPRKRSNLSRLTSSSTLRKRDSSVLGNSRAANSVRTFASISAVSNDGAVEPDRPPSPSVASTLSASSGGARRSNAPSEPRSSITSQQGGIPDYTVNKTVAVTTKLHHAGCLPGDTIPLTITVQHHKAIRSTHGIIVTLYRTAYVDSHPHIPIGPMDSDADPKYEDYYPRSRTGLGGLSLSNAGSSQMWRKDLYQTFKPLIIDPGTKYVEAKVNVKVPEDAFPTIKNAPGNMISFVYTVEAILDIHGKLAANPGLVPRLGLTDVAVPSISAVQTDDTNDAAQTNYGANCIDTMPLRRNDKQIVSMSCEVVVGTKNSAKSAAKGKAVQQAGTEIAAEDFASATPRGSQSRHNESSNEYAEQAYEPGFGSFKDNQPIQDEYQYDENGYPYYSDAYGPGYGYYDEYHVYHEQDEYGYWHSYPPLSTSPARALILPGPAQSEAGLSEKEKLRRAEEFLLPSQPPTNTASVAGQQECLAPSAPVIENNGYHGYVARPQFGPETRMASSSAVRDHSRQCPSAPAYHENAAQGSSSRGGMEQPGRNTSLTPTDDKGELERRRLQVEASEPEPAANGDVPSAPPAAMFGEGAPLASATFEEDEISAMGPSAVTAQQEPRALQDDSEDLPRYER